MRAAAIDVGTNTVLLLAARVENGQIVEELANEIMYARLGEGIRKTKAFAPVAMERARKCFARYKEICDNLRVEKIICVGTSASRNATNAREFYTRIENEFGIHTEIIPGEREANLSFLGGLLPGLDPKKHAVMDIGGGSTEFVVLDPKTNKVRGQSLEVGCVVAAENSLRGDPYTRESVETLQKELASEWVQLEPNLQKELRSKAWVAVAGTPTTLASLALNQKIFLPKQLDGYRLERCIVADLLESLAIQSNKQREANPIMGPGRADLMVSGTAILLTAMEFFDKSEVIVSTRGLRHGVLLSLGER